MRLDCDIPLELGHLPDERSVQQFVLEQFDELVDGNAEDATQHDDQHGGRTKKTRPQAPCDSGGHASL